MEKQALIPGLISKAVGFTAGTVVPKTLTAGYKGLVRPVARMAFKHPGMALTGAMMPSWIGGYMNEAGAKGLSSLPRSLPKFASVSKIRSPKSEIRNSKQGEQMSGEKYPAVFYQVEGFKKMAAESEVAHRLVKKAFFGSLGKMLGGSLSSADVQKTILGKVLDAVPENTKDIPKYLSDLVGVANMASKKPSFGEQLLQTVRNMPAALQLAIPAIPAIYFAERAVRNALENKKVNQSYSDMLKIYPELQNENPQNTRQYFNYIKQYSPTVAKNPHAAGAIVKRFASTGGMAMDNSVIKSLLEVEKVKSDAGRSGHQGILGSIGEMI